MLKFLVEYFGSAEILPQSFILISKAIKKVEPSGNYMAIIEAQATITAILVAYRSRFRSRLVLVKASDDKFAINVQYI